ncbi:uncharacterized protein LOC110189701 isoform X1 [Drosophila serrata]|uniref:uncharacterized protein LOC110189701 isoform X1 n=1 Tax=Drosophila serrata TaxID=7274 RepID=UPI000A1CF553|nr:uncharacterized protein LOC110189701 isoform X1 [Drosophila serrata]
MAYFIGKVLVLLLCLHCVIELQGVFLTFTNVTCEVKDISIGVVDYCDMKTLRKNKNSYILRYNLNKPMMNNIWVNIDITVDRFERNYLFNISLQILIRLMKKSSESNNDVSQWQPYLYPINFELCRVLKTRYNHVAKMAVDLIDGHSNFNHSCPYLVS